MKADLITEEFGSRCFNDRVQRTMLAPSVYSALRSVIEKGGELTIELADEVAASMKAWAISQGATHYTHWFLPMTGSTAEKHTAFVVPDNKNGGAIMDFTGKMLIKGEADASSFPSGGLRATFEARGYTTWDCTSYPFVKKDDETGVGVLCIPTAFCSFTGDALDEKTPLLRSMSAVNKAALRVLKLLGVKARSVSPTVGGEQEYFLVDKAMYKHRKDLIYTGRTLYGAAPAKGQELDDQFYAAMSERVSKFMAELNDQLWRLGVPAQTQHYEAAPAQYEIAPIFETCNIAVDHNALIMDIIQKVADHHNFACLLHEKPFNYVNGSGKHDNWSLCTDTGLNLLKPGKNERDNQVFLTFLTAVISAVDENAEALRMCCATLGNSWRLGGNEAPPTIISIFTGSNILEMLEQFEHGISSGVLSSKKKMMSIGVDTLPLLLRDESDRNRTSPFAFTGNKFEFRMVGSSQSLGLPNTVLNTIVAEQLDRLADAAENAEDTAAALNAELSRMIAKHKRIIYNGNNYSADWTEEAKRRGLPVNSGTVDAILTLDSATLRDIFERHSVFSASELESRREIYLKSYITHANIEAVTMSKLAHQRLLPAVLKYSEQLASAASAVGSLSCDNSAHIALLRRCCDGITAFSAALSVLDEQLASAAAKKGASAAQARAYENQVIPAMVELRKHADALEMIVDKEYWPLPSYGEMMYYIV